MEILVFSKSEISGISEKTKSQMSKIQISDLKNLINFPFQISEEESEMFWLGG